MEAFLTDWLFSFIALAIGFAIGYVYGSFK